MQLNHRKSLDFDFFSSYPIEKSLVEKLSKVSSLTADEAKKLIEASVTPPIPPPMEEGGQGPIGGAPSDLPMGPRPLNGPLPEPAPPAVGEANPNWSALNRVNQRVVSREGDE